MAYNPSMGAMNMKVYVSTISSGTPRIGFVGSFSTLDKESGVGFMDLASSGPYLDHGRQESVLRFMDAYDAEGLPYTHLMFIDDDESWESSDIQAVFAAAKANPKAVVGGIYWSPINGDYSAREPIVYSLSPGERGSVYADTFAHRPMPWKWVAAQTAPFACDAIGTGFMCVPRDLLLTMQATHAAETPLWAFETQTILGVACGEDLAFCYRAKALGYQIIAVPTPTITHFKTCKIGPRHG